MKNPPKLFITILGCEIVGLLGTPFTATAIPTWYIFLEKPFFSPPNWIFGPVWALLYFLMGVSAYLAWTTDKKTKLVHHALHLFWIQLLLNFLWSLFFFGLHSPVLGLIDIIALLGFIFLTIQAFMKISRPAAYLLIPYFVWVCFATLLNAGILLLNI